MSLLAARICRFDPNSVLAAAGGRCFDPSNAAGFLGFLVASVFLAATLSYPPVSSSHPSHKNLLQSGRKDALRSLLSSDYQLAFQRFRGTLLYCCVEPPPHETVDNDQ